MRQLTGFLVGAGAALFAGGFVLCVAAGVTSHLSLAAGGFVAFVCGALMCKAAQALR